MWDEFGNEIDVEEAYREALTAAYGETVSIAGIEFDVARALEELDPIGFRCGVADYESAMIENNEWFEEDPTIDDEDED